MWCRSRSIILVALFAVQSRGTASVARVLRPDHAVSGSSCIAVAGLLHHRPEPGRAARLQPGLRRRLPARPRHRSASLRWARCSSRSPAPRRSMPISAISAAARSSIAWLLGRAAGAGAQLSRAGRAGAGQPEGDRESVLPALSRMGAAADGGAGHGRHRHRQPGGDHRRLFADPAGDPARPAAASRRSATPPEAQVGPDLHPARQHAAAGWRAAAGAAVPLVERAGLGLRHRRHRHHGGDGHDGLHRHLARSGAGRWSARSRSMAPFLLDRRHVPGRQPAQGRSRAAGCRWCSAAW